MTPLIYIVGPLSQKRMWLHFIDTSVNSSILFCLATAATERQFGKIVSGVEEYAKENSVPENIHMQ